MSTNNAESLKYEPIASPPADPAVRLSDFVRLIAELANETRHGELPVIV